MGGIPIPRRSSNQGASGAGRCLTRLHTYWQGLPPTRGNTAEPCIKDKGPSDVLYEITDDHTALEAA